VTNVWSDIEAGAVRRPAPKRRVDLSRVLFVALLLQAISLTGNAVLTFATRQPNSLLRWAASAAVPVLIALLQALVEALNKDDAGPDDRGSRPADLRPDQRYDPGYDQRYGPRPEPGYRYPAAPIPSGRRRGTPVLAAILVVLSVVGVGGLAVSAAAQFATGYFSGKEVGPDVLVKPKSASRGDVGVTVTRVWYTRHFTRVEVTVRNSGSQTISLPLFGFCVFTGKDGTTLQADSFRSQWSANVPPGGLTTGTVTFPGQLPAEVTRASFSFTQIFGIPGGGAITVKNLSLRPAALALGSPPVGRQPGSAIRGSAGG
jgi:hypothetical protein